MALEKNFLEVSINLICISAIKNGQITLLLFPIYGSLQHFFYASVQYIQTSPGAPEQFPARRRSKFIAFRSACQRGSFTDPVLGFIASLLLYLYELQTK